MTADFAFVKKGQWVFQEGDEGNQMYVMLHGKCQELER